MKCPYCGYQEDKVLDSRSVRDGEEVKRRRECLECGRRFTTYEHIEEMQVMVIKKDQRRESFDRNKVLRGMRSACEKRPISVETLESSVDDIERAIYDSGRKEISSAEVGDMVIESLRALDQVAYVRFASVYWQFENVTQFKEIVDVLGGRKRRRQSA
ncbi:MAG: transcriptional regulator NrdR [Armatimonadota bacterium]